jgi:hypothetical protein
MTVPTERRKWWRGLAALEDEKKGKCIGVQDVLLEVLYQRIGTRTFEVKTTEEMFDRLRREIELDGRRDHADRQGKADADGAVGEDGPGDSTG